MNLKEWAESQGVAYVTARRWYAAGKLPVPARRVGGLILVGEPDQPTGDGLTAAHARSKPGSAGRRQRAAQLAAIHVRVANQRHNGLHKLTTRLARSHDTVVVEDLHAAGMVRNRRLARAVADAGMAEVRRQLAYKTRWYGSTLVVADRWYPSSKTCSGCGWRNPSLTLSERTFTCQSCGLVLDRDHNAAINLHHLVAASTPETENARGADRKTRASGRVAGKREPGTATAGQTGGASPRGEAA